MGAPRRVRRLRRQANRSFVHRVGRRGLHFDIAPGDPARVPLLMFNGIGAPLQLLQTFVDRLDPAIEVIRVDPPGVGRSPGARGPYRMARLARMIDQALAELGYDQVDVLGISWGGALAQQFAWAAGARCRRVVLIATGVGYPMSSVSPSAMRRLADVKANRGKGVLGTLAGEMYGGQARRNPRAGADVLRVQMLSVRPFGWGYQMLAGLGWTSAWFLPLLRQPTLILAGTEDPVVPPYNGRVVSALARHGELYVYSGGHVDLLVNPKEELLPQIESFLARR